MKNIRGFFTLLDMLSRLGILRLLGHAVLARFTSVRTPEEEKLFLATLLTSRYFETSRDEALCLLLHSLHTVQVEEPQVVIDAIGQILGRC